MGADGAVGPQGPAGPTGPQGEVGPQGPAGPLPSAAQASAVGAFTPLIDTTILSLDVPAGRYLATATLTGSRNFVTPLFACTLRAGGSFVDSATQQLPMSDDSASFFTSASMTGLATVVADGGGLVLECRGSGDFRARLTAIAVAP